MKLKASPILLLVASLIIFVGGIYLRTYHESCAAFSEGSVALEMGHVDKAVDRLSSATGWRAPGVSCAYKAGDMLLQATPGFSDQSARIESYRRLRSAVIASRGILDGGFSQLRLRAEEGLAKEGVGTIEKIVDPTPLEVPFLYNILRGTLLVGWIGATLLALWRGFTSQGRPIRTPLLRYGIVALVLYLSWLFSLN